MSTGQLKLDAVRKFDNPIGRYIDLRLVREYVDNKNHRLVYRLLSKKLILTDVIDKLFKD